MKIVELVNKISVPITNEEADLLAGFDNNPEILKSELGPRQQILANHLVNKNILRRIKNELYFG